MTLAKRPSPAVVVLIGRGFAQAGFFVFTVGPSLVLTDQGYNDLLVGITVMLLAVVAPAAAFQQHVIRYEHAAGSFRDARIKSLLLASACSVGGVALATLLTHSLAVSLLLGVGSILSVVPSLVASLHALGGDYVRSACVDAISGVFFGLLTIPLIVAGAGPSTWATSYIIVWIATLAAISLGPLRLRRPAREVKLGAFGAVLTQSRAMIAIGIVAMAFNRADYLTLSIVGVEAQASRFAIASRIVGPMLIALGSLNNSLYVRQIQLRDRPDEMRSMTQRASRKVGVLAVMIAPVPVAVAVALSAASSTFAGYSLIVPTALLTLATVPYAFAIPYGFAFNSQGRERVWLAVILVATLLDLVGVAVVGRNGATATATLWVFTQLGVLIAVVTIWRKRPFVRATAPI